MARCWWSVAYVPVRCRHVRRSGAPHATRDVAAIEMSVDPNGRLVNDGEEGFEGRLGEVQ
jgi:hypothetical protein